MCAVSHARRTSHGPLRTQTGPLLTQPAGTPDTPEPVLRHRLIRTQGEVRRSFMSQLHTNTYTKMEKHETICLLGNREDIVDMWATLRWCWGYGARVGRRTIILQRDGDRFNQVWCERGPGVHISPGERETSVDRRDAPETDQPTCGAGALIRTASNTRQTGDVVEVPRGAVRDGLEGDDELLTEKGVEFNEDK